MSHSRSSRSRRSQPERLSILVPPVLASRISRRALLGGLAAAGSSWALTACGGDGRSSSPAGGATPDGEVEDALNIYTWADYDDPENLKAFEATGPRLQVDSYGSNEEMLAKLVASKGTSGYDIVVPTGIFIPQMVQNGLLQELDKSKIPNFANLDPAYTGQPFDPENTHSVCKSWGTTGFVYDTSVIGRELTSWADFLDAAQKEAAGNTTILEDPWEVTCMWFAANGIDPNTTDPEALAACREFLVGNLAPHVKAFNSNPGSGAIPQNTAALMQCWNGDARLGIEASSEPDKWRFVYPTPTANIWMDNWCIAEGAQHPDAAYAFIDFMLDPEVSVNEILYIGYHTGVEGVVDAAMAAGLTYPEMVFPPPEVVSRLTGSQLHEAHGELVDILGAVRAAAGA